MFIKGRAGKGPRREQRRSGRGGQKLALVAPPPALGSTSRPHFRRETIARRRSRKSGRRFAASRKMAAAAATVNGTPGVSSSGPAATSGAILQAAAGMYEQLKDEWNRKSPNLSKCGEELGRLKVGVGGPQMPGPGAVTGAQGRGRGRGGGERGSGRQEAGLEGSDAGWLERSQCGPHGGAGVKSARTGRTE